MDKYGDKEAIYDTKISPLMDEIVNICKSEGINMAASFQLRSEKDPDVEGNFLCTTLLPAAKEHYPENYRALCRAIFSKPMVIAVAIQKGGSTQ